VTLLPRNAVRRPRLAAVHQPSSFDLAPGTAPELTGGHGLGELRTQIPDSQSHLIPPIPEVSGVIPTARIALPWLSNPVGSRPSASNPCDMQVREPTARAVPAVNKNLNHA
jgi:hypothetical protein